MDAFSSDCLRLVLAKIVDPVCLASVSHVCKEWRALSAEQWPVRTKQWRFGWKGRWETLSTMGLHLQVFGERWQADKQALACVKALSLPCGREKALGQLRGMGPAYLDVLLAAAAHALSWPPRDDWDPSNNPNLQEALAAVQTVTAADELKHLMASDNPDLDKMERGLLCIAQTYAPENDVAAFVMPFLDTLAKEALSRICSQEGCTNHQALDVVTHLVFGPRHPAYELPLHTCALPLRGNTFFQAAAWPSRDAPLTQDRGNKGRTFLNEPVPEWEPPPKGYGLGLEAMRSIMDDPCNLSRMLMHKVLGESGKGPAELLHVIHASICQRVGLPVHLMKLPLTPYFFNVMAAPASFTYRGSIHTWPSKDTDIGDFTQDKIEVAVDVSDGACVEAWESLLSRLPPWVQGQEPELVKPQDFILRWCQFSWRRHMRPAADNAGMQKMSIMITAMDPDNDGMYVHRIKSALMLRDPGDAVAALQGLTAHIAAHPTLAYVADIPQIRAEIQQLRQMLSVKKA